MSFFGHVSRGSPPLSLTQSLEGWYSVCGVMGSIQCCWHSHVSGKGHGWPTDLERQEMGSSIGWTIWNCPFLIILTFEKSKFYMVQPNTFSQCKRSQTWGLWEFEVDPGELFIHVLPGVVHQLYLWLTNPRAKGHWQQTCCLRPINYQEAASSKYQDF